MNELVDAVVILVLVLVLHGPMLRFVKDLSRDSKNNPMRPEKPHGET